MAPVSGGIVQSDGTVTVSVFSRSIVPRRPMLESRTAKRIEHTETATVDHIGKKV